MIIFIVFTVFVFNFRIIVLCWAKFWPSGIFCCWPDCLELIARRPSGSGVLCWQLYPIYTMKLARRASSSSTSASGVLDELAALCKRGITDTCWRQFYFRSTNVYSALQVFTWTRYKFTLVISVKEDMKMLRLGTNRGWESRRQQDKKLDNPGLPGKQLLKLYVFWVMGVLGPRSPVLIFMTWNPGDSRTWHINTFHDRKPLITKNKLLLEGQLMYPEYN